MVETTRDVNTDLNLLRTGGQELRRTVYSADDIAERVGEMGRSITDHYPEDADLLLLGLLKGSFIFVGDLVRRISRPLHVDFLVAASYVGKESTGEVEMLYHPRDPIEDRHVVLVEDIVDTGTTLERTTKALLRKEPASLEICALLHKHKAGELPVEPRWVGFDAPNEFLVGYGLDHAEDFRHLPFIAAI